MVRYFERNEMKITCSLVSIILCWVLNGWASPKLPVRYLGIEQGLSNNNVSAIFEDSHGFMWFGTTDVLNRWDGYEFKIYKHQPGMPLCLPDSRITDIDEDPQGRILV